MDSAIEILGFLIGTSLGLFLLISLIVLVPGRSKGRRVASGVVWLGGPGGSEHGVSTSGLVLADHPARWATQAQTDWAEAAEVAEPSRHVGGASAGW